MDPEKTEERYRSKRMERGGKGAGNNNPRSRNPHEKRKRTPRDVTGINPGDMRPIDPKSPYIPPA